MYTTADARNPVTGLQQQKYLSQHIKSFLIDPKIDKPCMSKLIF